MLNKLVSTICCFMISCTVVLSQRSIRVGSGIGTFMMEDLKDFQVSLIPDLGVNVKSLSKFPPYFGYDLSSVRYNNSGLGFGITSDFISTGGTNYYGDYSGSYKFSIKTQSYNLGLIFSMRSFTGNHLKGYFEIHSGVKYSRLSISEKLVLKDISEPLLSESLSLENFSWWAKPVYRVEYKLNDFLSAGTFLGVEINPNSKLHLKGSPKAFLTNENGQFININWTGFRIGLYISFNMVKKIEYPVKEEDIWD
jgi:hypothetical protein